MHDHFPPVKFTSRESCLTIAARKPYVSPILVHVMACHRKLHLYPERLQASTEVHTAQSVWPWHRTVDQAVYVHRYVCMNAVEHQSGGAPLKCLIHTLFHIRMTLSSQKKSARAIQKR